MGCRGTSSKQSGWSARVMWRDDGEMESYMYYPYHERDTKSCGVSWGWERDNRELKVASGEWVDISMYVKVNTPGAAASLATASYSA